MAILVGIAQVAVVGDVAPEQIAPYAAPSGALGPEAAGVQSLDGGVADEVFGEAVIEFDDIGVWVADGCCTWAEVAFLGQEG